MEEFVVLADSRVPHASACTELHGEFLGKTPLCMRGCEDIGCEEGCHVGSGAHVVSAGTPITGMVVESSSW